MLLFPIGNHLPFISLEENIDIVLIPSRAHKCMLAVSDPMYNFELETMLINFVRVTLK
jgi:hypothetical protein